MGGTPVDIRQRPGYKAAVLLKASGPAQQPDSIRFNPAINPAMDHRPVVHGPGFGRYLEYTWNIPGIFLVCHFIPGSSRHSFF